MEILETLVSREINEINSAPQLAIAHYWKMVIKANGREITPTYIKDVKVDRLYHRNYADEVRLTAGFNFAEFQYNVLPYKDTLEVTLTKIPMGSSIEPNVTLSRSRVTNTYKVQLINQNSQAIQGDHPLSLTKNQAGREQIVDIPMQLYNPVIDTIRKKTFGTVFRDTSPLNAIAYVLVKYASSTTGEANNTIRGVNVDPSFEITERKHIVVPHNTPVLEVPHLIDDAVGGTHPAQMRYYLQGNYWNLYPIFDHQRFSRVSDTVTIIKIPKHRMPSVEKTYRWATNHLILLTTRGTTHQDNSESLQLNEGNGVRFVDANQMVSGLAKKGGNKVDVQLKNNLTEVVYQPRADKSDMIMPAKVKITNKYNKEYAELARKSGGYIQTVWEHANIDLLLPGMPVRYIFQDGEVTRELYGTLNAVETLDYNTNNTISNPRFVTMALLTIFVSNISPMKSKTATDSVSSSTST